MRGAPDPNDSWLPSTRVAEEPPTEQDLQVAQVLTGRVLALGANVKNPVIRLRQHGRRLKFDT